MRRKENSWLATSRAIMLRAPHDVSGNGTFDPRYRHPSQPIQDKEYNASTDEKERHSEEVLSLTHGSSPIKALTPSQVS